MKKAEIPLAARAFILRRHIWLLATVLPLLDRVLSLNQLLRLLTPPGALAPYAGIPAETIAEWVAGRLRRPRQMRRRACLRHGLTLFHFLRLASCPAVLQIGVFPSRPGDRRLHAHCWVTLDGVALSPPPAEAAATVLSHGAAPLKNTLTSAGGTGKKPPQN